MDCQYFEAFLDWAKDARPFWIRCHATERLIDRIETFLTFKEDRNRLRVFVFSQGRMERLNLETKADQIRSGKRLVFSLRDSLESAHIATLWAMADRAEAFRLWRPRLYGPYRIPKIFGPPGGIEAQFPELCNVQRLLAIQPAPGETWRLLAVDSKWIHIVDTSRWGYDDAIKTIEPRCRKPILDVVGAGDSRVFVLTEEGLWLWDSAQGGWKELTVPRCGPDAIVAIRPGPNDSKLYLIETARDGKRRILVENAWNGMQPLHLGEVEPWEVSWSLDGGLLVVDAERRGLWYVESGSGTPHRVFAVEAGRIHYWMDSHGVLYVLDAAEQRLHLFFHNHHWTCRGCGTHRLQRPPGGRCPECGCVSLRGFREGHGAFVHWVDFSLEDQTSLVTGPLTVDGDLNFYVKAAGPHFRTFSLSRKDLWEEEKD